MASLDTVETLELNDLANLTDISFPSLAYVDNLLLLSLPSIRSINLNASIQGTYKPSMTNWTIQNTSLVSFTSSMAEQITNIVISNNSALQNMNLSSLVNVGNMNVSTNPGGAELSMETLWTASNLSFSNLAALNMPQLGLCNGNVVISGNNVMILQLGNISRVQNSFQITDNPQLNTLNLTGLVAVSGGWGGYRNQVPNNGNLVITGNGQLGDFISYFGSVYGDLYLSGPWSK